MRRVEWCPELAEGPSPVEVAEGLESTQSRRTMPMSNTSYVYILQCSDGSYYVGSTDNLQERIQTHNAGRGSSYTARRRPVYYEPHES